MNLVQRYGLSESFETVYPYSHRGKFLLLGMVFPLYSLVALSLYATRAWRWCIYFPLLKVSKGAASSPMRRDRRAAVSLRFIFLRMRSVFLLGMGYAIALILGRWTHGYAGAVRRFLLLPMRSALVNKVCYKFVMDLLCVLSRTHSIEFQYFILYQTYIITKLTKNFDLYK